MSNSLINSTQANSADLQIKFAVVMYGGGSLAIYINGVAQEFLKLVQATESNSPNLATTTKIYRKIAFLLADENKQKELARLEKDFVSLKNNLARENDAASRKTLEKTLEEKQKAIKAFSDALDKQAESTENPKVRFVIDVLTGSSAGGINAVYLAKALVNGIDNIEQLRRLWIEQGDFAKLLNDKKSVSDNQLQPPIEPVSLLNSRRMYLELLKALDGMEDQANIGNRLVEQLDLYVTYTDFRGLPLPIQLSDKNVLERRHKQVFNFRYNGNININDFTKENNPFLAFAARSTSAFPFAFEPSRLTDIDEVIDSSLPQYAKGKSDNEAWEKYFGELTDENGEKVVWKNRSFVDGGALDNKPFGYAIDKLVQRPSEGIVRRKLLYIEPAPEEFMPEKDKFEKPDAIQNLLGQGVELPRYETIREDLQRVLSRNHLIRRVKRITDEVERDFEKHSGELKPLPKNLDWTDVGLNEIVTYKGMAFLLYYRLRVSSVTDDIARLVTSYFRIDSESDYSKILRCLIRIWRDRNYLENKREENGKKIETDKTLNKFLYRYDVDYRFRRLQFIMQKAEYLLRCKDEVFKRLTEISFDDSRESENREQREQAVENTRKAQTGVVTTSAALQKALPDSNRKKFIEYLKQNPDKFVEEVKNIQYRINEIYLRLRRENEFLLTGLNNPKLAAGLLTEKEYEPYKSRLENFIAKLSSVEEQLQILEAAKQGLRIEIKSLGETERKKLSLAALNRITGEVKKTGFQVGNNSNKDCNRNDEIDCIPSLKEAYGEDGLSEINERLSTAAESLNEFYNAEGSFLRYAADGMRELLGIEEAKNGDSTAPAEKGDKPFQPENDVGKFIREYLKNYYLLFDSYDQISFPIFFETPVGEAVEVDVVRISSRDAHSLINEEDKNEKRRKLAGNSLYNFGAFLDRRWRLNDIMWGRLDGAERLVETLLPGEDCAVFRAHLIQEANLIILNEMLLAVNSTEFQGIVVNALTLAGTEATVKKAVDKLVLGLTANKIQTGINTALIKSLKEEKICDEVKANYEVNRQLEPKPTLQMVSRATQVIGKVLERIAEKQAQAGNRVSWIARLGQIFWGLVTVAVPNSFANLLFVYWLYVLYLFEGFLIVGGVIFNTPEIQRFGFLALAVTVAIHLAVLVLHDNMQGFNFLKILRTGVAIAGVLMILTGIGFIYAFFVDNGDLWNRLASLKEGYNNQNFTIYQKLIPSVTLLVFFLSLLMWRSLESRRILQIGVWVLAFTAALFGIGILLQSYPPLLPLEFISDASEIANLNPAGTKTALFIDTFAFVPVYIILFLMLSRLLSFRYSGWFRFLAVPLAVIAGLAALTAAVSDLFENYFTYRILSIPMASLETSYPWLIQAVRYAAQTKWIAIFLCTFLLSFIFVRWQRDFFRLNNPYLSVFGGISLVLSFLLLFIAPFFGLFGIFQNNVSDMLWFTSVFIGLLLLGGFSAAITLFIYRQRFLINY